MELLFQIRIDVSYLGALAGQAIRVSLPWNVTEDAIDAFETAYARMAARMRHALVPAAV